MKEKDIYYSAIEANIANKNRIYRKAVNSRQRPGLKRGLAVAAACFVVMASVVACVPEARAMVLNWLKPAVNSRQYIETPAAERTPETNGYTIFAPPDELVKPYVGYSVSGGDMQYLLMSPLVDEIDPANIDRAYASDSMDISVRLPVGSGLKGNQQLTMFFYFTDMKTVRQNTSKAPDHISEDEYLAKINCLVALRIDGLTFDATAGTAAQAVMPVPAPVMLKGDVLVFSGPESISGDRCMVGNDELSIDGAVFEIKKLNEPAITFAVTLPEDWTDKQCAAAARAMDPVFIIDGADQGEGYSSIRYLDTDSAHKISFTVEIGLVPEDWSGIGSRQAVLRLSELTEYNGVKLPAGSRAEAHYEKNGWNEDSRRHILYGCPITVK